MADEADLYVLFMAEELMVVHLACDEGIGPCVQGIAEQESPCPATYRHA